MIILGTQTEEYRRWRDTNPSSRNNGAYWYAREIEDIILPEITANVCILTVGATLYRSNQIPDASVIVAHHNLNPVQVYKNFLRKNMLWVCSKPSTAKALKNARENVVYIPLSVDTEYVKKFRTKPTKGTAYVGNFWNHKAKFIQSLPKNIKRLGNMERDDLLKEMAKYKRVIAEGRCLIEAKVLGAETTVIDYASVGSKVEAIDREAVDSRDAIPLWRSALMQHSQTYNIECILKSNRAFEDLEAKVQRRSGEVFATSKERAEELLSHKANLVEKIA